MMVLPGVSAWHWHESIEASGGDNRGHPVEYVFQ